MALRLLVAFLLLAPTSSVAADANDWVNVDYVLKQGKSNSATSVAQNTIISRAGSTAKNGPWTIATKGINPPSGDPRDYLSWAPYHWPDCNWCSKGSTHFASPNSTTNDPYDGTDGDADDPDDAGDDPETSGDSEVESEGSEIEDLRTELVNVNFIVHGAAPQVPRAEVFGSHHRMKRMHRRVPHEAAQGASSGPAPAKDRRQDFAPLQVAAQQATNLPLITPLPTGIAPPQPTNGMPGSSTTASSHVIGTQAPAQAPAKTSKKSSCTPSPTKSLAPSATWTTCPYVVRDGKVNPDTDKLVGPDAVQAMSQSVLYNSLAYAIQRSSDNSKNVAKAIDAFFLSSTTGMHPNVNFGQMVRGPGKEHQVGTFTGILDIRGMVKVVNGLQLLRSTKSPDWTSAREQAMMTWMKSYINWLQTSDLGKSVASKANNHLSFYISQLAAAKIFVGDTKGAATVLQNYFKDQFQDQIAQSGEQPFEAVRTRPFHYRCFNLEAMITNAKLGDQLGLNFWTTKSKYGATIQTAVDYTMAVGAKGEDLSDIFSHVAAASAAYGDPKGKYAAFLQKNVQNYKTLPFWFYDQSGALPNSPAGKAGKRGDAGDDTLSAMAPNTTDGSGTMAQTTAAGNGSLPIESAGTTIPFECPAVFEDAPAVEVEDGLFVTCDELRPFFELPTPVE